MISFSHRFAVIFIFISSIVIAQIPKPSDVFEFEVGADYKLADYDQMLSYYEKLANSTDRVQMIDIGKSVMNRPIKLLFISSAENMKSLEKWRLISEQLSRATISDKKARTLSVEGKAVVWIDGGMHATERAHAQMTSELMWRIAAEESDEMKMEDWYNFVTEVGNSFLQAYVPIVERRKDLPYTEAQRTWQEIRRGRYVEFNLVHDKGTLFGLKTNGRIESILMSLPPHVQWVYDHHPEPASEEEKLLKVLEKPIDWL